MPEAAHAHELCLLTWGSGEVCCGFRAAVGGRGVIKTKLLLHPIQGRLGYNCSPIIRTIAIRARVIATGDSVAVVAALCAGGAAVKWLGWHGRQAGIARGRRCLLRAGAQGSAGKVAIQGCGGTCRGRLWWVFRGGVGLRVACGGLGGMIVLGTGCT